MIKRALPLLALAVLLGGGSLGGCSRAAKTEKPAAPRAQIWGSEGTAPGEFRGPRAIVAAKDGYVYVADRASHISKWSKDGKYLMEWTAPVVSNGRFEGPEGITDLPGGDIAVTNTHASRVLIYDTRGHLKSQFGSYGTGPGQFLLVTGITTDAEGFIYLADYGGEFDRICKYTREGKQVANWAGHGEGPRQFRRPCGLAIDSKGDLLVADIGNHRIQVLDRKTGAYKAQFSTRGRKNGEMTYPYGVAVDGQGFIYTVEYSNHRVQKWTPDYQWVASWGSVGRGPGQLQNPWGLSVAPDGTVYVADTNNNRVVKFHFN